MVVRTNAAVRSLRCSPCGVTAELAGGERLSADMAVVGLGATPNTRWLDGVRFSGTEPGNGWLANGVACDDSGAVRGLDRVFAIGDVARWPDPVRGGDYRTEHWISAHTQADIVARRIAGVSVPRERAPDYVWSDQYRVKIQVAGRPEIADRVQLLGDPEAGVRGRVALYFSSSGRLTAAVTFGAPRMFVRLLALIGSDQDVVLREADAV